jgi:hypothetical protein
MEQPTREVPTTSCGGLPERAHSEDFLNSDIEYRHFYLEGALNRRETSDQLNQRYLRGAMKTGCQAILD